MLTTMVYDDFNKRYPSAIEALAALQQLRSPNPSPPASTIPILPPPPVKKQPKPPLILIGIIIISLSILITIVAIVAIKNNPFNSQNEPTPSQTW